jgi:hypothetical protein
VDEWLDALNLSKYKPALAAAGVQVAHLPTISDQTLQAAGVALVGHRKRMLQAAKALVVAAPPAPPTAPLPAPDISDSPATASSDMDVDPPSWQRTGTGGSASSVGSVGPGGSAIGATTAVSSGATTMDVTAMAPKEKQQQKANSTSSIFITSTLIKPDMDEVRDARAPTRAHAHARAPTREPLPRARSRTRAVRRPPSAVRRPPSSTAAHPRSCPPAANAAAHAAS